MRTMKSGGAALAGGGNAQLVAQLLQPLAHPGTAVQAGDVKVHMIAPEYAEYAADCAARGKRDDAEKKKELAETAAMAVKAALASAGPRPTHERRRMTRKGKKKKYKLTAAQETDSDAAGDPDVSSSDSDPAPPSPAAKAKAKRLRQTMTQTRGSRAERLAAQGELS